MAAKAFFDLYRSSPRAILIACFVHKMDKINSLKKEASCLFPDSLIKLISESDDAPLGNLGMRSVKESFALYEYNIFAVLIRVGLSWTISKSSGSQTFFDATHLKMLTRLCDAPNSILKFSLLYCKINVTHNPHKLVFLCSRDFGWSIIFNRKITLF